MIFNFLLITADNFPVNEDTKRARTHVIKYTYLIISP